MNHNKSKQNISEYAGILLQMKMRASASLMKKRKPFSPKPINNLSNEVSKKQCNVDHIIKLFKTSKI